MSLFFPKFSQSRPKRTFEYKPRYYDEDKERLEKLKKKHEGEDPDNVGYMKERLREEFRAQRPGRKGNGVLGRPMAFVMALAIVLILIWLLI